MKRAILVFSLASLLSLGVMAQCCKPKNTTSSAQKVERKDLIGQTGKFKVTGMTCAGCSKHLHDALTQQEGILDNQVEYPGDIATVTYNPEKMTVDKIIEAIESTGYKAQPIQDERTNKKNGTQNHE